MKVEFQRINFAVAPPPKFKEARGQEWYEYGQKNNFPAVILDLYNSSSLHNAIVTQKAHFIAGKETAVRVEGTVGEKVGAQKALEYANPYESWQDIKYKASLDLENFGGFAFQAIWNAPGTRVLYWYHLPFDKCRVNKDASKVWYSDDWNDKREERLEFPAFDLEKPGGTQVLWFKQYRAGEGVYPLPDWYPARTYIEIDTKISDFHFNNISNGFSLGKIIQIFKGEPTEDIKAEFDRKFKANTTGTENANGVLISWMEKGEDPLQVVDLMPGDFDKQYLQLSETVRDNIFYAHRVTSPMLFGVRVEGALGGRNELKEAYEVFDRAYVAPKRTQMDKVLTTMFNATGKEGELYTIAAEPAGEDAVQLFTAGIMTRDEVRESLGLKTEQPVAMSAQNPFGWNDEADKAVFRKYGRSAAEFEELPETFAELTNPELRLVAVIRDNPKATLEELAKGARLTTTEAANILKTMQANKLIEWTNTEIKITDSGARSISDSGGLDTEIFVLYKYGKNPDVGGPLLLDTSREFCKFLVEENKLYSREEIDAMSRELGYNVWQRRGGWRTIAGTNTHVPQCRHIWESKLYRRTIR
jgi:DNA-binding Lrp family transcriptional regulator